MKEARLIVSRGEVRPIEPCRHSDLIVRRRQHFTNAVIRQQAADAVYMESPRAGCGVDILQDAVNLRVDVVQHLGFVAAVVFEAVCPYKCHLTTPLRVAPEYRPEPVL